jgi:excisionase family DNA binding protein
MGDKKPSAATIKEVAKELGISAGSVYLAAKRGELPVIKIGRRLLVPRAPLDRMLGRSGADV